MGNLTTYVWESLLETPGLIATFDTLPGYTYPPAARRVLCHQYALTEVSFDRMLKVHCVGRSTRHWARLVRDGWDLLFEYPALRQLLDEEHAAPRLDRPTIIQRCKRFNLSKAEMVNLLNVHAEIWSRA